ncbi:MAG: hypothetical protein U1E84_10480 [Rhodoferax sp.]
MLAGVQLQHGVTGGKLIREAAHMVVLVSIALTALLMMAHPFSLRQWEYALLLGNEVDSSTKGSAP